MTRLRDTLPPVVSAVGCSSRSDCTHGDSDGRA
ncbi:MAG: hypothetical protein JWR45_2221 [Blastococcus sp.]|jgi:hypothetical protein|nr:hypothetical protein [Blastococcus sp.]